jgi:signal transduction histidine kinase/CheY-like chemotaxis protein
VTIWNKAATEFFDISAESAINKNLWELSDELKKYQPCFEEVVATMLHKEMYHEVFKKSDFKYKNISIFPLVDQGIKGVVIRIDDITDLEKSEQQLRQMQKMETVGTLAGGLAHDFNNVLGGIIGTVSILQHKIRKNIEISKEELIEHIATMEQSGQRSVDMVQQLLTLSRKQDLCFAPVDLNYTLRHVLKICQNTFDKCIELVPQFSSSPAMVNADPTQLEQVLLNLCVNGYHSMTIMKNEGEHQGGILTIAIGSFAADNFFCHLNPDAEKIVYWVLSVIDSGIGIDLKTQSKIFDPFYTTKEKGKGTGLGLAMVYNIVKQHHGFIKVYSEIGIGSTFNVYLPALIRGKEISQASIEEEDIPRGAGTVLVIDDEPVMRKLATEVLRECGYETILAENGIEGLEIFKKERAKIKLVLLDMVMPKMSGEEVFKEIKAISQDAKVILVSGFKQDNRIESALKSGATAFIQKPYTLEKLAKVIDKAVSFSQE